MRRAWSRGTLRIKESWSGRTIGCGPATSRVDFWFQVHEEEGELSDMQEPPGGGGDPIRIDPTEGGEPIDAIELAVEELAVDGMKATIEERVIRLVNPVMGSPHVAVLQALGAAAAGGPGPFGAAAHGPAGVAAALWHAPDLYIVRWTGANRWVAAYRFPPRTRPDAYLREESGIPSRLSRGNWYGDVPEEMAEAFFGVGLLLDEPPFAVPAVPTRAKPPPASPPRRRSSAPGVSGGPKPASSPPAPRTPRPKPSPRPAKTVTTMRACPGCNLKKHPGQFVPGSDLCVDCR
jgi:hypothetical protein